MPYAPKQFSYTGKPRGSARERGYDSRWEKRRKAFLEANPLCVHCLKEGVTTPANVVDHVIPHRGNKRLFDDPGNLQPLCVRHHAIKSASGQ